MSSSPLVLGIDFGTSGVKIAVINNDLKLIYYSGIKYVNGLENWKDWQKCCKDLIHKIPNEIRKQLIACAVDGTSGTIIGCDQNGNPLGHAVPYFNPCMEHKNDVLNIIEDQKDISSANSSIPRAFRIITKYGSNILLRHQADWINGWLLSNWNWGEEGNNLKLGWDSIKKQWPSKLNNVLCSNSLPEIVPSGKFLGTIAPKRSKELDLPINLKIISGTTDSNAAVLATESSSTDGITVLGSTIVIKRFVKKPIQHPGITKHLIDGRWLAGGASNAGCSVLTKYFNSQELRDLSRQIDPESNSGIILRPLSHKGERFPVNDPNLEPILTPRPVSDSLYLHAMLEGLARIEAQGWKKLLELDSEGAPLKKIITIGGGSRNPQWRRIRERSIGMPIHTCAKEPAEGVARIALKAIYENSSKTFK